jgi:hypothetical protein
MGKVSARPDGYLLENTMEGGPSKLPKGLKKHQATALMLLRTEVIGLNAWLAEARVPNIIPRCPYGWYAQTVRHIVTACPSFRT